MYRMKKYLEKLVGMYKGEKFYLYCREGDFTVLFLLHQ